MRLSIAVLVWFGLSFTLGALQTGRTPQKQVSAYCELNSDDNSMKLNFFLDLNGDPAEGIFALTTSQFRNNDGTTNIASCQFGGSQSTVLSVESKVFFDGSTSTNPCGMQPVSSQVNSYRWYFGVREFYDVNNPTLGITYDMDVTYSVTCTMDNANEYNISPTTTITVVNVDDEADAVRIRPVNQMSILKLTDSEQYVQDVNAVVTRDQLIKLRVQTKAKEETLRIVALDHYGSYVHSCDYRTSFNGIRTTFVAANGCPNNVFSEMIYGFRYTRVVPSSDNTAWYESESGSFKLPSDTFSRRYYITCYIGYCYGNVGSDAKCTNYCGNRRRRAIENTNFDSVSTYIDVEVNLETSAERQTGYGDGTMMIAVVAGVSVIVLAAIVVLVIFICLRRRQQEQAMNWARSSVTGSNLNLPQHIQVRQ